jgi:hypothetical protein
VYSHRSTQRYKRKPFVSHYWDCRLKGRPPGTPKSDDPNKKKRKRTARERDLCDVKIKITEYFPGAMLRADFAPDGAPPPDPAQSNNYFANQAAVHQQQQFSIPMINANIPPGHPGATGQRYYTIQRVNGNGGNGKGDGVAGPHKHGLDESDRVKKNSILRYLQKRDKEEKKTQVNNMGFICSISLVSLLANPLRSSSWKSLSGPACADQFLSSSSCTFASTTSSHRKKVNPMFLQNGYKSLIQDLFKAFQLHF